MQYLQFENKQLRLSMMKSCKKRRFYWNGRRTVSFDFPSTSRKAIRSLFSCYS